MQQLKPYSDIEVYQTARRKKGKTGTLRRACALKAIFQTGNEAQFFTTPGTVNENQKIAGV